MNQLFYIFLNVFILFSVFAQIGQMSGPSHRNKSVARGCFSGTNISAQPCVEVQLFPLSAQHMLECIPVCVYIHLISICDLQNLCLSFVQIQMWRHYATAESVCECFEICFFKSATLSLKHRLFSAHSSK